MQHIDSDSSTRCHSHVRLRAHSDPAPSSLHYLCLTGESTYLRLNCRKTHQAHSDFRTIALKPLSRREWDFEAKAANPEPPVCE